MTPMLMKIAAAALPLCLVACATTPAPRSIAETAANTPELSTLSRLIGAAGLDATLRGDGPYTVFAPSNDAFAAVPQATMDTLAKDPAQLKAVLTYHVVPGRLTGSEVKNGPAKTVQGGNLALSKAGQFVTVEDAVVTRADLPASNGVVHVVDRVLMPPKR